MHPRAHLPLQLIIFLMAARSPAGLVGHWEFNEGTGTTAANAADAAFPGALANFAAGSEWTSGPPGKASAVLFDGTDDIINTSYTGITGSALRSLSAWIKYTGAVPAELDAVFSYGSNATSARWTVRMGSGAGVDQHRLRLEISGAGVYGNTNLNDNQWHHIAVVQTGATLGTVLLYVDGAPQTLAYNGSGAGLAINTSVAAGQEVAIGGSKHSTTYNWEGGLDDVRFFDHALTPAEITALYSPAPAITSFTALPGNLTTPGQAATLSWSGSAQPGATWTIAPVPGDVSGLTINGNGSVNVTPTASTTYTLTVTDAFGTANADVSVGVNEPQQQPVINEVMAANDGYLDDENGDTPDWIELRNPNSFSISIAGYRLRDGGGSDWAFPANTFLAGNSYLRVFASGKDRTNPVQNLHTNFSLSADGELLELRAPGGATVVDSMPASVVFPDNVTWGRISNGAVQGYLATPTPGTANSGAGQPGPRIEDVRIALPGERQPVRPLLESGTVAADSMDQFSGVQGQNGWTYGWSNLTTLTYTTASFTPFPGGDGQGAWNAATQNWNTANSQWGALWERGLTTSPNCDLGRDYTLPSLTGGVSSPVRRWISNFSGPAVLSGFFHKVSTSGDATRWQVFVNGSAVLDADPATAGMQPFTVLGTLRRFAVPVTLAAGDVVDMLCDANGSETSDTSRGWLRVWRNPEAFSAAAHDATLPIATSFSATGGAVTDATLYYVINFGTEQSVAMSQGGTGWTAGIPLTGVNAGDMIRWRVTATDSAGGSRNSPPYPSTTDSPKYHGTVAAGVNPAGRTRLDGLSLFIQNIGASKTTAGTRASLFWNGRFYDNVDINLHASNAYAKRSWDVDFNKGHRFQFTDTGAGHTDVNLLTNWRDRSKLRNPMSYYAFALAGHPTLPCETVHLELNGLFHSTCDLTGELNEGSLEDSGYDENGALYKVQNLFRTYPADATSNIEKRTRKWESGSADLTALLNGMVNLSNTDDITGTVNNSPRFRYLADNVDVASLVNFIAGMFFSTSYDWGHKNYALYFDADGTRRWTPMVWDLDLSWGHYYDAAAIANTYFDDVIRTNTNDGTIHNFSINHNQMEFTPPNRNSLFAYALEDPTLKAMILRRLRHLAEQFFLHSGPAPEIEGRMNALTDLVDPPDIAESDADLDLRIWGYWNQHQTASNTYTPRSAREEVGRITGTFVPARRGMYFNDNPPLGESYGGPVPGPALTNPAISLGSYDAHPASGNQDHEFIEVVNSSLDYADLTGWKLTGGVDFTFPAGSVISPPGNSRFAGRLIVAKSGTGWRTRSIPPMNGEGRFVLMAYTGQLASTGETVELRDLSNNVVATLVVPPAPSDPQQWLRVTELHYHPLPPTGVELAADATLTASDYEYVELMNTRSAPLDVSGCSFDNGITFTFPANTTLAAGQRVVLSRKPSALALRSPALTGVFGPYTGSLDNAGERLTLRDAFGEQIISFVYDDNAPWPTAPDGSGSSLVLIAPTLNPDFAENWRASTTGHGNPTATDTVAFAGDPHSDTDQDTLDALMEYALGTSDSSAGPFTTLEWNASTGRITLDIAAAADDAALVLESSGDLGNWTTSGMTRTGSAALPDGRVQVSWQLAPLSGPRLYLRARATLRP
jgi:hypothetical protein